MLKLLHTSDWHLGHIFHGYDREPEFRHFFNQLYDIIKEEKPDAVLISGDIFDTINPTLQAQRLWAEVLETMSSLNPDMNIVAITGNHDNGSRISVSRNLYKTQYHIIGKNPEILKIKGRDGDEALICAVPYIHESTYKTYLENPGVEENAMRALHNQLYDNALTMRTDPEAPIILMAHTAVSGADFSGQDKYRFNFNDVDIFGDGYDYIALGHIHYPQNLTLKNGKARYCGSPIPMSFDEDYEHSVSMVSFDARTPRVKQIKIEPLRKIITKFGQSPLRAEKVKDFIKHYTGNTEIQYLRVNYCNDGDFTVQHGRDIETAFADHSYIRLCVLRGISPETMDDASHSRIVVTPQNVTTTDPILMAKQKYQRKFAREMPQHLEALLKSVIENIDE